MIIPGANDHGTQHHQAWGSENYHFELSSPATEIKVQMISVCTSTKASDDLTLGDCQSPLSD
jgi:hypothetical protein